MPDDRHTATEADLIERARKVLPAGGFGNFPADTVIARGKGGRV
jgi:glutamate-1-semialdehyde 2,1-aminomutase